MKVGYAIVVVVSQDGRERRDAVVLKDYPSEDDIQLAIRNYPFKVYYATIEKRFYP